MNIKNIITIAFASLILLTGVTCFFSYMNVQTEYQRRNNALQAAFEKQKSFHDGMWKTLKMQFGLKEELKETTLKTLDAYSQRGEAYKNASFVWVTESFPNVGQTGQAEYLKNLAITIEAQNEKFTAVRDNIVFATNEYNNFVTNPWNQFFLSADQEQRKDSKIITSTVTDNAANTLKDDMEWMNN